MHDVNTCVTLCNTFSKFVKPLFQKNYHWSLFSIPRTSHGQIGCWGTGACVRVGVWLKSRLSHALSPRSLPRPLRPPGVPCTLPRVASLSDIMHPGETWEDSNTSRPLLASVAQWCLLMERCAIEEWGKKSNLLFFLFEKVRDFPLIIKGFFLYFLVM